MAAGAYIYGGLSNLGDAIQRKQDEQKERARKFKALVEYADSAGIMPKDAAITMDADALEGRIKGAMAEEAQRERALDMDMRRAQLQDLIARQQDTAGFANAIRGAQRFDPNAPTGMFNAPALRELSPGDFMGAALQYPQAQINPLIARAMAEQAGAPADFMPQAFDVGGISGVVSPRTGAIVQKTDPSAVFDERLRVMDREYALRRKNKILEQLGEAILPEQVSTLTNQLAEVNAILAGPQTSQKAPYPDGTPVKDKKGKLYVVRNGVPVPVE